MSVTPPLPPSPPFAPPPLPAAAQRPAIEAHAVRFTGLGSEYFRVWIVNVLLMLATLGLYTPFARYRSIKYFYGHTQVAGSPLEFSVRRPWRMFLGFVVMLSFYGLFEAQEIFDRIPKTGKPGQDLLCEPLKIDWTFYCKKCDGMASMRTCPHTKEDRVILSGTKLRKMLSEGLEVPDHFGRDEVLVILREYYSSLTEKVEVKMQRAASGSAM